MITFPFLINLYTVIDFSKIVSIGVIYLASYGHFVSTVPLSTIKPSEVVLQKNGFSKSVKTTTMLNFDLKFVFNSFKHFFCYHWFSLLRKCTESDIKLLQAVLKFVEDELVRFFLREL